MKPIPISVSDAWTDALRAHVGALPADPDLRDIEQLRDRLTSIAWQDGCPTAAAFDTPGIPRRYRRHLVVADPANGFTALLIAWPPGHRTPLHDHDGLWGIELVIDGALAIEEFSKHDMLAALEHQRTMILGIGDATAFTGPGYVHSCRNLSAQRPALSLHIYGGALDEYSMYSTSTQGRYTTTRQRLGIDAILI